MCGRARLTSDVSEIKLVFSIPPWSCPAGGLAEQPRNDTGCEGTQHPSRERAKTDRLDTEL